MRTYGIILLTGALLLAGAKARSAGPDPEPPPPIKVESVKGAGEVEVKGWSDPVLTVRRGRSRGTCSFVMTLAAKAPPKRITLQFQDVSSFTNLAMIGSGRRERFRLNLLRLHGKLTYHLGPNGRPVTSEERARLTVTFDPMDDYVEVVVIRHKGHNWPEGPIRVSWRADK